MVSILRPECSFTFWYPIFKKVSLEATIIPIPDDVLKYLEHGMFVLPLEAARSLPESSEWNDSSSETSEKEEIDHQPTFPEFSQRIQDVLDEYGAIFIKSNWSSPKDATWIAPTKTLKCETLEEVYLLLKSSNRIAKDLSAVRFLEDCKNPLSFCLVLKQWQDIDPPGEFRCFVVDNELIAISQRDTSQYYHSNELEKYSIQTDIKKLFSDCIKGRFPLHSYSFDIVRHKMSNVKIVDFGMMDEQSTEGMLFAYEELQNHTWNTPEFRFIGEEIGLCLRKSKHLCVPEEIKEFLQSNNNITLLDMIRKEVESQRKTHEEKDTESSEST